MTRDEATAMVERGEARTICEAEYLHLCGQLEREATEDGFETFRTNINVRQIMRSRVANLLERASADSAADGYHSNYKGEGF